MSEKIVVVGGCGHVGLPLSLLLSSFSFSTTAYDIDSNLVEQVNSGSMPFLEEGCQQLLDTELNKSKNPFYCTSSPDVIKTASTIIIVVGTPVDDNNRPNNDLIINLIKELTPFFNFGQHLILRSTIYPGTSEKVYNYLSNLELGISLSYCPERIAEGEALRELTSIPQIIGSFTEIDYQKSLSIFNHFGVKTIKCRPEEAEYAKLFSNVWRYVTFAASNQFMSITAEHGLDYQLIRKIISLDYPRARHLPISGFASGPCLLKDSIQLADSTKFSSLIDAAIEINSDHPKVIMDEITKKYDLRPLVVGLLGMSFKPNSDDGRSSLSYELKRLLESKVKSLLTTDPFIISDPELVPLEYVLTKSDLLIIATPHDIYQELNTDIKIFHVWK